MKGIQGLILAVGLGIAGAMFNWAYLANKAQEVEKIEFIAIAPGTVVNRGDRLTEEQLVPLGIPKASEGNLRDFAFLYSTRQTVIGAPVWRALSGGTILLREDLKTPPQELNFGQGLKGEGEERAMAVHVEANRFVPSLFMPGDQVSFVFPRYLATSPTPAIINTAEKPEASKPVEPKPASPKSASPAEPGGGSMTEIIGPFRILSLGNRLGSPDVMRAAKIPQVQENVLMVAVKVVDNELEPKAEKLWRMMQTHNAQQMGVMLHPRTR